MIRGHQSQAIENRVLLYVIQLLTATAFWEFGPILWLWCVILYSTKWLTFPRSPA